MFSEAKKEVILNILNDKNQSFLASKITAEICKNGFKNSSRTTKKILDEMINECLIAQELGFDCQGNQRYVYRLR